MPFVKNPQEIQTLNRKCPFLNRPLGVPPGPGGTAAELHGHGVALRGGRLARGRSDGAAAPPGRPTRDYLGGRGT